MWDQLLIQMANRLHWQLNEKCKLLRIGGDEFLLIAENTNADEAVILAESFTADSKRVIRFLVKKLISLQA